MAQVKVGWKFNPDPYPFIAGNGKVKRGNYCHACGRPLKDAESIARGYDSECWKSIPVIIVLDIQAVEQCLHPTDGTLPANEPVQTENNPVISGDATPTIGG